MKAQSVKSRGKRAATRKPTQGAALTRLVVLDAIRTWLIPTLGAAAAFVIFVLYNIDLLDESVAVTVGGGMALAVVLFFGVRGFLDESITPALGAVLVAFAVLWSAASFYPFYRAVNPGTPLFRAELNRNGAPVTIPMRGLPGRYRVIVEGHFLPTAEHSDRAAQYSIAVGRDATTERVLEGTFSEQWGSQRIGAGRRSIEVSVMHPRLQQLDTIDDPDGHDLVVRLTQLSPGVRDTVTLRLYAENIPQAVLIGVAILTLAAAVVIDSWRPKGVSEGLLATLTIATLVSVAVFRASAVAAPGFPQLIVASLIGTLIGALAATLLWRLTLPIRKYLPARP